MNLNEPFLVASEVVEEYRNTGRTIIRGLLSPDALQPYRDAIANTLAIAAEERNIHPGVGGEKRRFVQITNLWRLNDPCRAFVFSKRFASVAAQLMGAPAVRLYHDQALFKEPGGKNTPWHQDQHYWPLDTDNTITMWMALCPVTAEMGAMSFADGSHKEGFLGHRAISDENHVEFERLVAERGWKVSQYELQPGDATFHSGLTLHMAGPNRSSYMREAMTVIYYPDGTRIMEPDSPHRQADLEAFHPGQKPGELAASLLNPILFP